MKTLSVNVHPHTETQPCSFGDHLEEIPLQSDLPTSSNSHVSPLVALNDDTSFGNGTVNGGQRSTEVDELAHHYPVLSSNRRAFGPFPRVTEFNSIIHFLGISNVLKKN